MFFALWSNYKSGNGTENSELRTWGDFFIILPFIVAGVDGTSLCSLVSLHQSLISFIFSENNHFEQHM